MTQKRSKFELEELIEIMKMIGQCKKPKQIAEKLPLRKETTINALIYKMGGRDELIRRMIAGEKPEAIAQERYDYVTESNRKRAKNTRRTPDQVIDRLNRIDRVLTLICNEFNIRS